jgi:hypothetical protein
MKDGVETLDLIVIGLPQSSVFGTMSTLMKDPGSAQTRSTYMR